MEGVAIMGVYEAALAPPMWPITIQTSKPAFEAATSTAREVGWGHFQVEEVVQICFLMAQELIQQVILTL
jgi:hypothetical protein